MPTRDSIHAAVVNALIKEGWIITDDPLFLEYGGRHVFIDLGVAGRESLVLSAERQDQQLAVEIKGFGGLSPIRTLEQAVGQFVVYNLLLEEIQPGRTLYLAVPDIVYAELFSEPLAALIAERLPLRILVIDCETEEIVEWLPSVPTERF